MSSALISYQLYSARNFPPLEAVIAGVAEIGYRAVEPYDGVYEKDPAAFRKLIDRFGLQCPTAHMSLQGLSVAKERYFEAARILGLAAIVVPYLAPEERPSDAAGWRSIADRLKDLAAAAGEAGFSLAWHNHDFEYRKLADGSRPIDILLAAPGVMWEADVGWIARAGASPKDELTKYCERLIAVHAKDLAPAGVAVEDGWADVGFGLVDWPEVLALADRAKARVLVVEHDNPSDWRRSAERSFASLRNFGAGRAP